LSYCDKRSHRRGRQTTESRCGEFHKLKDRAEGIAEIDILAKIHKKPEKSCQQILSSQNSVVTWKILNPSLNFRVCGASDFLGAIAI
jgi:hypothetical protein